jgi:predicted nuclease of predicted toxin-antitoxin system
LKLKLDENLSERHAVAARERGHDATTVLAENLCAASDATVLETARSEGRVLVTMDKDLSNTVRFPPQRYAGIVLLRLAEPVTLESIERRMRVFLDTAATRDPAGHLWIIDGERVREFGDPELN